MSIFSKRQKAPEWLLERGILGALLVGLEDGVIVYDKDFKVVDFNKAAESIFSIKAKDIVGGQFSLSEAKNFKSKVLAQVMFTSLAPTVVKRSSPGSYPQVVEVSLDDPLKEFKVVTNQVLDESGGVWGFVKVVKDITREKELLKAKSDFITIAAHRLRTPATGVNWALDLLSKDGGLNQESSEVLAQARKTMKNLLGIINDLLNIAQVEEGKFGYQFKKAKLVDFLNGILTDAEVVAREYGVKLYFNRPKDTNITTPIDYDKLGQAISNLIDNAIKYNIKNGEVVVSLELIDDGKYVQVSVKDTGIGMSKSDLDNLFTKFFRTESSKKAGVEGSGLGLYLTKNIINRHGGRIWAESRPGRGSVFYFTLPTDVKMIPDIYA